MLTYSPGRYDYTPFGIQTKLEGRVNSDFGFAGIYRHSRSDLNLTLRAYNPRLARWLSRDPIEQIGSLNLFVSARRVEFQPGITEFFELLWSHC